MEAFSVRRRTTTYDTSIAIVDTATAPICRGNSGMLPLAEVFDVDVDVGALAVELLDVDNDD